MQKYEKQLGLVERFERIRGKCEAIIQDAKALENEEMQARLTGNAESILKEL